MAAEQLITENINLWTSAIKVKATQGRGSSSKRELYGIKKLRELILELAVRGKLVPQVPSDEPASVLLERIAAEKAQLVKDKKIKKPKKLPEISEQERKKLLPHGWSEARLGDVLNVVNGRAYKKHEMLQEGTPLLRVGNLFTSKEWYYSDLELEPAKYIDNGDLIYAWSASFGPFIWTGGRAIYHYHIWKLDLFDCDSLSKNYLYQYLLAITEEIKASGSGIAMVHMTKERMEKLVFPVPPLSEQHRIVAKVDKLMALCDQLEQQTEASLDAHQLLVDTLLATLTNAQDAAELSESWARLSEHFDTLITTDYAVEQLKQTILQLAVMGKLVPQDPNDEPASELLKRIAAEKEQLIKDKKIKKQKPLPEVTDTEKPFDLPEGWEWCRFGDVAVARLGKMLDKAKNQGQLLPYLRNTNVQWHRFNLEDIKEMQIEADEIDELLLRKGDLLICEGGHPGRCAIWQNEKQQMFFQKALHRARSLGGVLPEHLQYCLTIDATTNRLDKYFTGATIKHFVGAKLNSYVIPLPPVEEQKRIVAKIDQLIRLCDQLKIQLSEAQTTQLQLADTVVDEALN